LGSEKEPSGDVPTESNEDGLGEDAMAKFKRSHQEICVLLNDNNDDDDDRH
jgi:hypothetical protein